MPRKLVTRIYLYLIFNLTLYGFTRIKIIPFTLDIN